MAAPKVITMTILDLPAKCPDCEHVMPIGEFDKHAAVCMKPKCAAADCEVLQADMTRPIKVKVHKTA